MSAGKTEALPPLREALNSLESVLCDPEGKACIRGSDADNAIIDGALSTLRAALAQRQQVPEGWRDSLIVASIALRQLTERAKQVKVALDANLPDGAPVHPQSGALTWPISTALLAIDKIEAALTAAPPAQPDKPAPRVEDCASPNYCAEFGRDRRCRLKRYDHAAAQPSEPAAEAQEPTGGRE